MTKRLKGVDLFAGAGGFTLAAEAAGVEVVQAINHWDLAVQVHETNHPHTRHAREDLVSFDFEALESFDLLVAGPSCQGHSKAGQVGRKRSARVQDDHKQLRATAWAVHRCLKVCRPRFGVVENVPLFLRWSELAEWVAAIEALGYKVTQQLLLASRFGVAQQRWRVFFVFVLDGPAVHVSNPDAVEPGACTVFDPAADGWVDIEAMRTTVSKKGHLTAKEKARHANRKLGGALGWGMHVNHEAAWGRPASEPVNTLTTRPGQLWWVRDGRYRQWTDGERLRAMGFPADYDLCGATKEQAARLLGNAVPPPLAEGVIRKALRLAA